MQRPNKSSPRSGFNLIELTVATAILVGIFLAIAGSTQRQGDSLRFFARLSYQSQRSQVVIGRIEEQLEDAQPAAIDAFLVGALDSTSTTKLGLDTVAGFPDRGVLILDAGTAREERIGYEGLRSSAGARVLQLTRALCGSPSAHPAGTQVLWAGAAFAIGQQGNPPSGAFDGISSEPEGPVYFRGEGSGFSFRKPIDLGAGLVDGLEASWGAELGSGGLATGRNAILFVPSSEVSEADLDADLNRDRDQEDVFDVGDLRLRTWDSNDGLVAPREIGLGGSGVLQERCNHGGDLDGDGFADPIFLWHPDSGRVRVRLFFLTESDRGLPKVQRVETTLCLRNPAES